MDVVDIARLQFGAVTVFHFLFVPLTIGLSAVVAAFETWWILTRRPELLRLTRFLGTLLLINVAVGVVTGIVQEFQFGMNWSSYSRYVGDVFGAPLALEALLAFFLESTFLGLWIFGWGRLPRAVHAACMGVVHVGTLASAWFILAANSWMQNPVGYRIDEQSDRAVLTDFGAVMLNPVQLVTFPHVVLASYLAAGAFLVAVGTWLFTRKRFRADRPMYLTLVRVGASVALVAGIGVAFSGDAQGKVMTEVQPMKMAAAEGLYESRDGCAPFSVLTVGSLDGERERWSLTVPCLLSFLATGSFDGSVQGIDDLRAQYRATYGADPASTAYQTGDYVPTIPVTYWTFRLMIGLGMAAAAGSAVIVWVTRRGRVPTTRWLAPFAVALPVAAVAGSSFGWIFTEVGRQPWVVFGVMTTDHGVSPGVDVTSAAISLGVLTAVYAVLAVVETALIVRTVRAGAPPATDPYDQGADEPQDRGPVLTFAY
jgi:cytochrome d ubiquinol oxidase subunit I